MKKIITLILIALISLMDVGSLAEGRIAEGADSDWYMNVLADENIIAEYPYHAFIDLNGNGVPVLIISTTENDFITDEDKAIAYVYAKGEAKAVLEVGGGGGDRFYANLDERTLTHWSRLSGEAHIEVYHVENDVLMPVTKVDYYAPHHNPEQDSDKALWFQDGKAISEADGQAVFDLYALDNVITYEKLEQQQ